MKTLTGGRDSDVFAQALAAGHADDASASLSVLKLFAPTTAGREHCSRERAALTGLETSGVRTPRALFHELDRRYLGRPFVVMEHIAGTSFWQAYEAADQVRRGELVRRFVVPLVALHAADPRLLRPTFRPPRPQDYLDEELRGLRRDSAGPELATLTGVLRWLEEHRHRIISWQEPAVLHCDYHPWNVLVDQAGEFHVLDWDWRIGDVRFDLAWTTTLLARSGLDELSGAVQDEYRRQTGRCLDHLKYFEVLATTRWLVNITRALPANPLADTAEQADFRAFLVEPVSRAQELLREHTSVRL